MMKCRANVRDTEGGLRTWPSDLGGIKGGIALPPDQDLAGLTNRVDRPDTATTVR